MAQPKTKKAPTAAQLKAAAKALVDSCDLNKTHCLVMLMHKSGTVNLLIKGKPEEMFKNLVIAMGSDPEMRSRLEAFFEKEKQD